MSEPARDQDVQQSDERRESSRLDSVSEATPQEQRVSELLEHSAAPPALAEAVEQLEAPDAADTLEAMPERKAAAVLELMDAAAAAEALSYMNTPMALGVLEELIDEDPRQAVQLIQRMAPDDAADLLQAMDHRHRTALLAALDPAESSALGKLVSFDKESAAGLMTPNFIRLHDSMTVAEAIEHIRESDLSDDVHHVLVVNDDGQLVGVIGLRRLITARGGERVGDLVQREVDVLRPTMDREEVARAFDRYDFEMLPVVDAHNRPMGIVTVDDVIDIIRAEQTEDTQLMVGAGKAEAVYSGLREKLRGRLPWLLVNLGTSSIAAIVVLQFDDLIAELAILAVLMPVIANQAGNAGQQSLAVTLRGIVLDEVRAERVWPLLLREAAVGAINGTIAGSLVAAGLAILHPLFPDASFRLGIVAAVSMAIALALGCFTGASIPILMRRFGVDPATASTIFLTMVTDSVSFLTFLGAARLLSHWLLPA